MRNKQGNADYDASSAAKSLKNRSLNGTATYKQLTNNSHKIFKVFGVNYASQQTALCILRKLAEEISQSIIAKKVPFSLRVINYWTSKFLRDRLIREKGHGKPRIFELTAFGNAFLTRCERGFSEPIVMEDYPVKFRLLQDAGRVNWDKLGQPENWDKYGFKVSGIRVEKNCGDQPTVVIHCGQLSGFDPDALLVEAGIIVGLVRARLLDLGVVTDDVGFPIRKKWFKSYTPEAEILNRSGTVETQDGHIDDSPPKDHKEQKEPHEERGYEQQKNYMAIPRRIQELNLKVDGLNLKIDGLTDVVSRIVDADNRIAAILEGVSQPRSLPLPRDDRSMVI
jgi:hypothetical protein